MADAIRRLQFLVDTGSVDVIPHGWRPLLHGCEQGRAKIR
jgi:hypothetical protein